MRQSAKYLCAAMIAGPAVAMAGDAAQLEAGRWEEKVTITAVSVGDMAIPLDSFPDRLKTEYSCVTPEEARDPKRLFASPDDAGECDQPQGVVDEGTVNLTTSCKMKDGAAMKMAMKGNYERATYRLDVQGNADMQGKPFKLSMIMDGRFVGACKGDEKDRSKSRS